MNSNLSDIAESFLIELQHVNDHEDFDCIEISRRFWESFRQQVPGLKLCEGILISNRCSSRLVPHCWVEVHDQIIDPSIRMWFGDNELLVIDKSDPRFTYKKR